MASVHSHIILFMEHALIWSSHSGPGYRSSDVGGIRLFPEFIQAPPCRSETCLLVELHRQERRSSR